jgi:ArsR family transcriptional regulator, arsenate/arsenite/antimonite-responsive transcriptional repressor
VASKRLVLDDQQVDLINKALADPKRFQILQKIASSSKAPTCSDICGWVDLSAATITHHLKEFAAAGLIDVERVGKFGYLTFRRDVWSAYLSRLSEL